MAKKILLFLAVLLILGVSVLTLLDEKVETRVTGLPWQIDAANDSWSEVFGVRVGSDTLSQVVNTLQKVPELAIFTGKDGSQILEAFFSRTSLGMLQGRFTAEMDAVNADLADFAKLDKPGKPMPSGKRKYTLSKSGLLAANELRVWKLAYLPATNYAEEQILQFFGEPKERHELTESVESWHYPAKGLIIAYDKDGGEIFYYSARGDYQRMLDSVPKKGQQNEE